MSEIGAHRDGPPETRRDRAVGGLLAALPTSLLRGGVAAWLGLGLVGLTAVLLFGLATFRTVVIPIIFGALAAAVFVPLVDLLERRQVPRGVGALLTMLGILGLVGLAVALVTRAVVARQAALQLAFFTTLRDLEAWLAERGFEAVDLTARLQEAGSALLETGGSGAVPTVISAASSAASFVVGLGIALIFLFFLLRDGPRMPGWAAREVGEDRVRPAEPVLQTAVQSIQRYFLGRGIVSAFEAATISLAAALLGVPLASAIAVATFVGAFIPYIGAFLAGLLAVVLALANEGLTTALLMLAAVLVVQTVLEPLLEARVVGQTLSLHPLIVIAVTTMGGVVAGFAGLILAAPLTATVVRTWEASRHPP